MMRVLSWITLMLAGAVAGAAGAFALEHPHLTGTLHRLAPVVSARPALREARGRLVGLDVAAGHLTLEWNHERRELSTEASTTVFVNGQSGGLSDLKVGQPLCASYELSGAASIAQWIEPCSP